MKKQPDRGTPLKFVVGDEAAWPDCKVEDVRSAHVALEISRRLRECLKSRNYGDLAEEANVSASSISRIVHGHIWVDIYTLSRLEAALGIELYPHAIGSWRNSTSQS